MTGTKSQYPNPPALAQRDESFSPSTVLRTVSLSTHIDMFCGLY